MASKPIRLDEMTINELKTMKTSMNLNSNDELVKQLLALSPFLNVLSEKKMTIEQAIEKLNLDEVVTEVRIIKKGINECAFNDWKDKLFAYNESVSDENKVIITQNLFLDLIGGNVNTISKLYKASEDEIKAHNAKLGLEDNHNRKLSSRIREKHGNVANWIKAQLS